MKYIFSICTGIYCDYFENFKNSINNFYPNEDKRLVIFSNELNEYNNWQIGNTYIEIVSIPDLLYTSILLNKFNYIIWYCKQNNINEDQIVYYFDIDTWFYSDNELALHNLDSIIQTNINSVIFSNHPYNTYILHNNLPMYVHGYIHNDNYIDPVEPQIFDDYSFSENNIWCKDCITSFFCGTIKSINNLNLIYTKYYKEIINSDRVIPQLCDEDIINYIWLKQLKEDIKEKYIYVIEYSIINTNPSLNIKKQIDTTIGKCYIGLIEIINNLICNQKYNIKIKDKVKLIQ